MLSSLFGMQPSVSLPVAVAYLWYRLLARFCATQLGCDKLWTSYEHGQFHLLTE